MPAGDRLQTSRRFVEPRARRIAGVVALLLLGGSVCGGPAILAQPDHLIDGPSLSPSPFDRSLLFRNGEYFRAYNAFFETGHSWSSYERLIRSEAAVYSNLSHLAIEELAALTDAGVNRQYRANAALRKGLIELKNEEFGRARLSLNDVIVMDGNDDAEWNRVAGEALFWIGASHLMESGRGGYPQALAIFRECSRDYPANPRADDALYYLGQIAESENDYDEALRLYDDLLDRYPQSDYRVASAIRRTQLLNMLHLYDEAYLQLEEAETIWSWHKSEGTQSAQQYHEEADLELVLLRGEISIGRNDLPDAERAYLALLYTIENTLDERYRRAGTLGLAETYRVAGLTDSAVAHYDRLLQERSDDEIARKAEFFRAVALLEMVGSGTAQREKAITILTMIADDDAHPMNGQSGLVLADRAYRDGEYGDAVVRASQVAATTESLRLRARALTLGGLGLMEIDRHAEAAEAFAEGSATADALTDIVMPERDRLRELALRLRAVALFEGGYHNDVLGAVAAYLRDPLLDSARIPELLRMQGESEYALGHYADAAATLERIVAEWPGSAYADDALYTLGWSGLQRSDLNGAESAFARLVKAYPLSPYAAESQIRRADCLYLGKRFGFAAEAYAEVATLRPSDRQTEYAAYQRAMALWQQGDSVTARRDFGRFVVDHGASPWADDALFMGGLLDYRRGEYTGAIAVMRQLLDGYQGSRLHARAYYTIADSYFRLKKFDEALAAYSIVTERFPGSSYMEDAEAGIVYARAAKEKHPERESNGTVQVSELGGRRSYELELRRAQIFLDANRVDDAEKEYLLFIERNPESRNLAAAWLGLAEASLLRRDTVVAIDTLTALSTRFTDPHLAPMAMLRLSEVHLGRGDTIRAIETLTNIRLRYPESAALATSLTREAALLIGSGREDDARTLLTYGASRLDTLGGHLTRSGGRILSELARLEIGAGMIGEARGRWALLSERGDSLGADAVIRLSASLQAEGAIDSAAAIITDARPRFAANPTLRARVELAAGRAYELQGKNEDAADIYRSIIERHGDDPFAQEARSRLEEMKDL